MVHTTSKTDIQDYLSNLARKTLIASLGKVKGKPCAIMFSGGFDSMLLAQLARSQKAQVSAVTIRFENFNHLTVDEASRLAQYLRLKQHILDVSFPEFLSAFEFLPSFLGKSLLDLDLAVVYAAFKKYDAQLAGKVFISGMGSDQWLGDDTTNQGAIDQDAHNKIAAKYGFKYVFPFLSSQMLELASQIPSALKKNKKLLRGLVPQADLKLLLKQDCRREIQVPMQVRKFLVKMYTQKRKGKADSQTLKQLAKTIRVKKIHN